MSPDVLLSVAHAVTFGWVALMLMNGMFWRARETDEQAVPAPAIWPSVTAVVPARDEAAVIGESLASLLAQDYPGPFRVVLVDDNSTDQTAAIARRLAGAETATSDAILAATLTATGSRHQIASAIVQGSAPPPGWTGKLWAVSQGIEVAGSPDYLWLTDADIAHATDTLSSLVSRAAQDNLVLNSSMVRLRTSSFAEKAIVPAFVWFFQMLYPFAQVNDSRHSKAAAAGGSMLVRTVTLAASGGIASIRSALIDDCALGAALKKQGPIRLQLSDRSHSLRAYDWAELFQMTARSAYAQLQYNPLFLFGTVAALSLLFLAPPLLTLFADNRAGFFGAVSWALMAGLYQPILARYGRSPLWGLALPLIAAFYLLATIWSALQHLRGRGGLWKGRVQARLA